MITIEKFLKFVSASTLAATLIFIVVVVVQEITKPKEVIERIRKEKCISFFELETPPENESDLEKAGSDCVFVPADGIRSSEFAASLLNFRKLDGFDYLFAGEKGILLKKNEISLEEADFIFKCFRSEKCPENVPDKRRTLTATALDAQGNIVISSTYENEKISHTAKNLKKLFNEIAKIKKLDLAKLRLILYFHSEYAYLEDKSDKYLISMPKSGIDGLYLKSRGAKIRLLPWEYSVNPLSVLDRKGVQYGLERDEYKKDAASVYFYRIAQFSEDSGTAVKWLNGSSLKKQEYSPIFSLRLIAKHLKNIQKSDGSFPTELETADAAEKKAKESLFIQAYAAEILFKSAEILEDSSLYEAAEKALSYVFLKEGKDDAAIAKTETLLVRRNKDMGYQYRFFDFDYTEKAVSSNFVYSGIFIEAFSLLSRDENKDEKIVELLKRAFSLFETANDENKMRFIAYLTEFTAENGAKPYSEMKSFLASQSGFIKSRVFDSRGFRSESGSFVAGEGKKFPDTSLSLLMSDGLMKALSNNMIGGETAETVLTSSDFINRLIVSGDDFPNWGNSKSKTMIQGGLRASDRAKSVKLSNTLRAASYFINRIRRERE
ncbi:hypothetical protein J6Z19_06005 [bacterium]|nr:hypothetical protein [bacterium]